jgi:hypothetical protein
MKDLRPRDVLIVGHLEGLPHTHYQPVRFCIEIMFVVKLAHVLIVGHF